MSFMEKMVKNLVNIAPRFKKRTFDPEAMSIEDIELPVSVMDMDISIIQSYIEQVVLTYKALDYINKPLEKLKIKEYHSYEISLMLKFIKENRVNKIANIEQVLPSLICSTTKKQLHIKVFTLVYGYDKCIKKSTSLIELEKDIRWTAQDAGYLLRYLDMENRNITN